MSELYQWAIIAFILLGIGVAVWRGGQANPESTGRIARRLNHLDGRVQQVELALKATATSEDITKVEGSIGKIEAQMESDRELAKRTHAAVSRIESFLIERALSK